MTNSFNARTGLLACTALASTFFISSTAFAQAQESAPAAAEEDGGLAEIIVTAQKREQSLQDVPIAITAITQESLQANRIYSVGDLSGLAPGVVVRPAPSGINVPVITMRGQASFGIVAGSDKQVSIYVDGVYIGSPRGSLFQLPDIQRLEVLRGPQGTLFGRNATAGAISISTRDPSGEAGMKVEGSVGNYNSYRARVTVDTPQFGPFSAYLSYVRNYKRGDTQNSGAGTIWDRSLSGPRYGRSVSPRYLGTVDTNSYFAAVKFEPSDSFKMIYKFDRDDDSGTPEATSILAFDRNPAAAAGGPLLGNVLTALYTSNNVHINTSAKRQAIVDNAFSVPRDQRVQGHSLTATWSPMDNITVKNIAAYRKTYLLSPGSTSGVGSLTFTQAALQPFALFSAVSRLGAGFFSLSPAAQAGTVAQFAAGLAPQVGNRITFQESNAEAVARQWSDELQVNYTSEKLQATIGAIYFHAKEETGAPIGQRNNFGFASFIPASGLIPLGNKGRSFNESTSLAVYGQLEYKILPALEVVGGIRMTRDKKDFTLDYDVLSATTGVISPRPLIVAPTYKDSKPSYQVGLNWTPNDDILVYGKYSNSFVSGGSTVGIDYLPETASSFEVGIKADFLDRRLRTNLALFHVDYNHFQSAQSGIVPAGAAIARPIFTSLYGAATAAELLSAAGTFVVDQGKVRAKGFELEVTAAPVRGLTLGGSVGYTDTKFPFINPIVLAGNGGRLNVTARPKTTASLFGVYETEPLFGDATLQFRVDGQYRSSFGVVTNPAVSLYSDGSNAAAIADIKGFALINGRFALRHIKIAGANAELAVWGKNLTDRKDRVFGLILGGISSTAIFQNARTYGLDLSISF
jgi:iron complex outermembrane recepter protein